MVLCECTYYKIHYSLVPITLVSMGILLITDYVKYTLTETRQHVKSQFKVLYKKKLKNGKREIIHHIHKGALSPTQISQCI